MNKVIIFELLSVLASVLLFRGLWLLLDKLDWFNSPAGLVISLAGGLVIMGFSLRYVHKCLGNN